MSDVKQRLSEGLEVAASGELSLDKAKAREKLRLFRLPDPHFYVLQFVRAASVLGATEIRFEFDVGAMTCEFDAELPDWAFENFWDASFRTRQSREDVALHNLALGIGSAQGLNPGTITVTSGTRCIVFTSESERSRDARHQEGTQIRVREKFRLGHVFDFFTDHAELIALRDHCRFSSLRVFVQGDELQAPQGFHRTPLAKEEGFAQLVSNATDVIDFMILRDDVQVDRIRISATGLSALVWLNSRTIPTDLSGMKLADPKAAYPGLLTEGLDGYHRTLREWARRGPTAPHEYKAIGRVLLSQLGRLERSGAERGPRTTELFEWWRSVPLFESALDDEHDELHPFDDFVDEKTLRYATRRFSKEESEGRAPILLISPGQRGLELLIEDAGFVVEDQTEVLKEELTRARNMELHEEVPIEDEIFPNPIRFEVELGVGKVVFALPEPDEQTTQSGGRLYVGGRLVKILKCPLPLAVAVDGDLEIDFLEFDIVQDERLEALAAVAVAEVRGFLNMLGRRASKRPAAHRRAALNELLLAAVSDALEITVLRSLGFSSPSIPRLMTQVRPWSGLPTGELLKRLGEAADAPLFKRYPKGEVSLRETLEWENPPIVATLDLEGLPLLADLGEPVLMLSNREFEFLTKHREVRYAYDAIVERTRRNEFFGKPPFDPSPHEQALMTRSHSSVTEHGSFDLTVEVLGVGNTTDLLILAHDRLVSMANLRSDVGQLRVIARSDDWELAPDFTSVEEDGLYEAMLESIERLAREVAGQLVNEACSRSVLTPHELEYVWWRARDGVSTSLLPAWVPRGDTWEPVSISLHEARRRVAAEGRLVHVTRHDAFGVEGMENRSAIVFRTPRSPVDFTVMFPGCRLIRLGEGKVDDRVALERFLAQDVFVPPLEVGMPTLSKTVGGFQLSVTINPTESSHRHRVHIVWEGRLLETITLDTRFGAYTTVVRGPAVRPDLTYRYFTTDRPKVLAAVRAGAEQLVRELCGRLGGGSQGKLRELEAARVWLLKYLISEHEAPVPSGAYPMLRKTPLFPTQAGRRVTYEELSTLAVEGTLSWSELADPRATLRFETGDIRLYERAVDPDFALLPVDQMEFALDRGPAPPMYHSDRTLNDIATTLVDVRGERRDLFDDRLALAFQWSDEATQVCTVHSNGVVLAKSHPLVRAAADAGPGSMQARFLCSVVYSSVNAYYRDIFDHDELELQSRLLAHTFEAHPE